jgi:hypothetical protein
MASQGWKVVRFGANEVVQNPEGIWSAIQLLISEGASPPLLASPPSGGEEHELIRNRIERCIERPGGSDSNTTPVIDQ